MKEDIKSSLLMGTIFAAFMSVFYIFNGGIVTGIITGILSGIVYALIFSLFVKMLRKNLSKRIVSIRNELKAKHAIAYDDVANYRVGRKVVGGWLFLTDTDLLFKMHNPKMQKYECTIPLASIEEVTSYKNCGRFFRGLSIKTKNGTTERFVVRELTIWIGKIDDAIYVN